MRRYLIVDDNVPFAENLAEILMDEGGVTVDTVPSGAEALERVKTTHYDLLISDMRMPVMGGAELVHRLRRERPRIPAIVITAYTNDDDLAAARQEGLLAVLPKPVPIEQLVTLAERARPGGLVALVEDDPQLSDNLAELLRGRGFAAVTAASVTETERLGDVQPFMALVDLRVPGGPDGAAMTRLARKFPGIPTVVVTGHMEVAPPEPYEALFAKPFNTPELMDTIEQLYVSRSA